MRLTKIHEKPTKNTDLVFFNDLAELLGTGGYDGIGYYILDGNLRAYKDWREFYNKEQVAYWSEIEDKIFEPIIKGGLEYEYDLEECRETNLGWGALNEKYKCWNGNDWDEVCEGMINERD